jgi:hypothetical protein
MLLDSGITTFELDCSMTAQVSQHISEKDE